MMNQSLNILYIGSHSGGLNFQLATVKQDWQLYLPATSLEALGMYIGYMPNVVIFEGDTHLALEVFNHLRHVTHASPQLVEAFLVLSDDVVWDAPPATVLHQLPKCATLPELIAGVYRVRQACDTAIYEHHVAGSLVE